MVYFPETEKANDFHDCIINHFTGQVLANSWLSTKLNEEITKLSVERLLKIILHDRSLHEFWHVTWRKFKEMGDIAIEVCLHLIQLIVRQIFSEFTSIKMENRIEVILKTIILVTGNTHPQIHELTAKKQIISLRDNKKLTFSLMSFKILIYFIFCLIVD